MKVTLNELQYTLVCMQMQENTKYPHATLSEIVQYLDTMQGVTGWYTWPENFRRHLGQIALEEEVTFATSADCQTFALWIAMDTLIRHYFHPVTFRYRIEETGEKGIRKGPNNERAEHSGERS